jgi:hypothetical protein
MASAFNKFQPFIAAIHNKVHNLGSDQLTIALCAAANAPTATMAVLADLTQISYTNLSSRNVTTTSSTQSSGLYKLICQDLLLTASGAVATFRYVVLYNSTAASGNLIAWWDYGADVTLANTETFNIDFDQANGVFSNT